MGRLSGPRSRLTAAPARLTTVRRKSAGERGYDAAWAKASKRFIACNPLCLGCQAAGRTERTTLTDHTIPHKGDRALFWDKRNWQASCDWHHNAVKQKLEARFEAGELTAEDLRLDSHAAVELTRRLDQTGGGSNP